MSTIREKGQDVLQPTLALEWLRSFILIFIIFTLSYMSTIGKKVRGVPEPTLDLKWLQPDYTKPIHWSSNYR